MSKILLLGAGRSATVLITYLTAQATQQNWQLTIADVSVTHLQELTKSPNVRLITFNIQDEAQLLEQVKRADLVISMVPALFHLTVARQCLACQKHLITASYVSPEIRDLHAAAEKAGLLFLMEAGLDPGIDHMSAMALIRNIRQQGGELLSFKSYTGGLIAPESDTNPWHYKFTWNPRNVVLAGQGTAKYLENGQYKFIPYQQLFRRTERLHILALGAFDGYANRDSLLYREHYGLQNIPTLVRGTLRRQGFCLAWDALVQLGLTDDTYRLENSSILTYRQFIEAYLPPAATNTNWHERLAQYLQLNPAGEELARIKWLGFEDTPIGLDKATPAQVLEKLLLEKWQLQPDDTDMVVMQHVFEYKVGNEKKKLTSSLVVLGEDNQRTAMAKTVGLPVGICAKLLLQGKLQQTGVIIPTDPEIYEPVLHELEAFGITFIEEEELV